jgi:hypothetical protein
MNSPISVVLWGTVPDWVGAIATALAFGFAAFVYWRGLVSSRRTERRSYALQFDVWIDSARWESAEGDVDDPVDSIGVRLCASNTSGHAMRHVTCGVQFREQPESVWDLHTVPPTATGVPFARSISIRPQGAMEHPLLPDKFLVGMLKLNVDFVDLAGHHWARRDGDLEEIARRSWWQRLTT